MATPPADPQFDTYAEDYDGALNEGLSVSGEDKAYFARGRVEHLARILAKLGAHPAKVLDFGCGTGSATPFFMALPGVGELIGVDVSARSLDVAIARHASARARFSLMDYHTPDANIDLVHCNGVFHHIPPDERAAALQYIWHSLKKGGLFALFENNPWNPGTRYVMSRIPFDRDAVTLSPPSAKWLLRAAGFEVLRADFLFYFPRLLKWLRPLEVLGRKVPLGSQYLILARKH